jgi:opacity protein-like surface antigen
MTKGYDTGGQQIRVCALHGPYAFRWNYAAVAGVELFIRSSLLVFGGVGVASTEASRSTTESTLSATSSDPLHGVNLVGFLSATPNKDGTWSPAVEGLVFGVRHDELADCVVVGKNVSWSQRRRHLRADLGLIDGKECQD